MRKIKEKDKTLSLLEKKNFDETKENLVFMHESVENKFLQKKRFIVKTKKDKANERFNYGYWTKSEHNKFIEALYLYNCNWKRTQSYLKKRTCKQISTHAQKFYLKLKTFKDEELGLDFTSSDIKDLKDIINIIKEKESKFSHNEKILPIISEKLSFGKTPLQKEKEITFKTNQKNQLNNSENKNINNINLINNKNIINNINYINKQNKISFEENPKDIGTNDKLAINSLKYYNLSSSIDNSEEDYESIFKNNSFNDLNVLKKLIDLKDIIS